MKGLLPECARNEITTGAAGNPVLRLGSRLKGATAFAEQQPRKEERRFSVCHGDICERGFAARIEAVRRCEIGKGFVVRAMDNLNIVPAQYVDRGWLCKGERHPGAI